MNSFLKKFILGSQLITNGDSQVSIFNYNSGDLLISLDLMKSYGTNLATFEFEKVREELEKSELTLCGLR